MAKRSKYEELVNETFEVVYGEKVYQVDVIDCKMVEKVSKTGRVYKVRRLWVCLSGSAIELEISTQSWNKKSFMRRLLKEHGIDTKQSKQTKQSTIRVIRGVTFGNITDLAVFGKINGLSSYYKKQYSFVSYKARLDEIYDEGMNEIISVTEALNKMDSLKNEINRMARCWVELEDDEDKGILVIDEHNLQKYYRGVFYECYSQKMYELIKSYQEQLKIRKFNERFGNGDFSGVYDYINRIISSQNKYGFSKCKTEKEIKKLYRKLSKELHPDLGGDQAKFIEMKKEYDRALQLM